MGFAASLGKCWLWLRRRGGEAKDATAVPRPARVYRLTRMRPGVAVVSVGRARTVPLKERSAKRTWRVTRRGAPETTLEYTELPDRLTPADFGLPSAVLSEANGVKYFYGAEDDITEALRR